MKHFFSAVIILLIFSSCQKEGVETITRTMNVVNFSKLNMGSNFDINVKQGTTFSVTATGRERDVNDLRADIQNGELQINYNNFIEQRKRVTVNITMPSLTQFEFTGNSRIDVGSFTEMVTVSGNVNGNSKATVRMSAPEFKLNVSGNSDLILNGQATKVDAKTSGNSFIDTYGVPAVLGYAQASGNSKIKVFASSDLFADASGNSYIYFKGNPGNKFFSESSNSKIIQE
jgi:Putative auto-transporter adhesin, head GIN domain